VSKQSKAAFAGAAGLFVAAFSGFLFYQIGTKTQAPPPPERPRYAAVFEAVDDALKELARGNIAFNVPDAMNLGDIETIVLLVSPALPVGTLQRMIEEKGTIEGHQGIRLSETMQARLIGNGVTPITPEEQAVSGQEPTRWEWQVRAVDQNVQLLHLSLNAILRIEGESVPRTVQTFRKEIRVRVTPGQRVATFLKGNWQWLWATILFPIGTWLWKRRQKQKAQRQAEGQPKTPEQS
jgi:hypothetical protein